jgi:hypothetical protein
MGIASFHPSNALSVRFVCRKGVIALRRSTSSREAKQRSDPDFFLGPGLLRFAKTDRAAVIPGCAAWRRPGIHNHKSSLEIPRSRARTRPARKQKVLLCDQGDSTCPALPEKINRFAITPNQIDNCPIPFRERDVSRSSRTLVRDAVDAAVLGMNGNRRAGFP